MNARRISIAIFILLFFGVMFGGLFHMGMGMDMTGNMTECPFMSKGESLCSMDAFEHLGAWQSVFTATLSNSILLLLLGTAMTVVSVAPHLLRKLLYADPPLLTVATRERLYSFFYRPFQELFARGILHPKLF